MSCILRLFGIKQEPKGAPRQRIPNQESEKYSVKISIVGPLPERDYELGILEDELVKRIASAKRRSFLAYKNACYYHEKGDMRRYVHYMNEKKTFAEDIQRTSKRLMEVLERRNDLAYPPPLTLPPPKLENATINPVRYIKNVPNHPSPPLVSTRPIGRSRSHLADTLPPPPPDLHFRA